MDDTCIKKEYEFANVFLSASLFSLKDEVARAE